MPMTLLRSDIFDTILDGTAALIADTKTGEILYATPLLEWMFGYHVKGELSCGGVCVDQLVPTPKREIHAAHRQRHLASGNARLAGIGLCVEGQRKDGSTFPVAVALKDSVLPGGTRVTTAVILNLEGRA